MSPGPGRDPVGARDHVSLGWILATALVLSGGATCFVFDPALQEGHSSDTLLHSLISTQRWTPFYWGQGRLGTLFSLLALPVRDPVRNLLVVNLLSTASALCATALLGVCLAGPRVGLTGGLLGGLLLATLGPDHSRFFVFMGHPEHLSALAFGLGGLLLVQELAVAEGPVVRRGRVAAGLALLALGCWVNPIQVSFLVPLGLLRGGGAGASLRGRGARRLLPALVAPAALLLAVPRLAGLPETSYAVLPPAQWPHAFARLVSSGASVVDARALSISAAALALASAAALVRDRDASRRRVAGILAGGLVSATVSLMVVALSSHVAANDASPRYASIPVVAALVTLSTAGVSAAAAAAPRIASPRAAFLVAAIGSAALAWAGGWPSAERVRTAFDARWGQTTREILAARCTHVTGDYWFTWVHVYYANAILYREASEQRVFGLAFRGEATRRFWEDLPASDWRVCAPRDFDLDSEEWVYRHLRVPPLDPVPVSRSDLVQVLVVAAPGDAATPDRSSPGQAAGRTLGRAPEGAEETS